MLYYAATGRRDYWRSSPSCHSRVYWEFQAVLSGRIAMAKPDGADSPRTRRLWLSAPGHVHGWTGKAGHSAQIVVFHFLTIPEILALRIPPRGCVELALSGKQVLRLRELACFDWKRITPETLLRSEHVLLELSLMVLEGLRAPRGADGHDESVPARRVRQALDQFSARMESNPGLEEIARAVGCSAPQLRKDFYAIMQRAPKAIFDQLRFQRALQLLASRETKLSTIGEACGFGDPSTFSRAFKAKLGVSPARWRGTA